MLLHDKRLNRLFISLCLGAILLLLINPYIISPMFTGILLANTEEEAVHIARHLAADHPFDNQKPDREQTIRWAEENSREIIGGFNIQKVKFFDRSGLVIFSTVAEDIGTVNTHDYFRTVVARGQPYSKFVPGTTTSLEGQVFTRDLVETYVPVMIGEEFTVVFELYFDVTEQNRALQKIVRYSIFLPGLLLLILVLLLFYLLKRLDQSVDFQLKTEFALIEKNNQLATQHQKLEETLTLVTLAKREWENTMDCIQDLVLYADTDGTVKRCNLAVTEFTGRSYEELKGRKWSEIMAAAGMDTRDFYSKDCEYFHQSTGRWYFLNRYDLRAEEDTQKILGVVITLHDLTEVKRIHEKLREKNNEIELHGQKLQKALEQISSLIQAVVDQRRFDIFFENPNLQKCWQVMNCSKKDCPCYGKEPQRCWQKAGTVCREEVQGHFAKKFGACVNCRLYIETIADPIYQIGEQFNNMMFILGEKNQELERAFAALKQTQAQLLQGEKMATIGQLAAGVAHEINNPIGFITSNLGSLTKYSEKLTEFVRIIAEKLQTTQDIQVLRHQISEAENRLKIDFIITDISELIRESIDGCQRVRKIVQDLKGFSHVDQAELKFANLNDLLESTINMIWNELKYHVTLHRDYHDLPPIECYPQQLNQVFLNILVNAAQAIEAKGEITVSTRVVGKMIEVAISDTGIGIPEDNISHIFEPFFTTKGIGKGTGLGMSIAYDIIAKHKGEIRVTSTVGKGSTFMINLPLHRKGISFVRADKLLNSALSGGVHQ